jgi:hypothetical protein
MVLSKVDNEELVLENELRRISVIEKHENNIFILYKLFE